MRWHLAAASLVVSVLLASSSTARAAEPMRGRTNGTTFEEGIAWVPRVVFYPFHLVAEYGLRKPTYAVAEWAERERVLEVVGKTLHPTPSFEWSPTIVLDLNTDAAFGGSMLLRNPFASNEELRASALGGLNVLEFEVQDRQRFGPAYAGIRQHTSRRMRPFFGLGPESTADRTYFAQTRLEGFVFGGFELKHFQVEGWEGLRRERVGASDVMPSIESRFDVQALPGFVPTDLAMIGADLRIDSRDQPEDGSGLRVLANATHARDVHVAERSFATTSLDLEAAVEVSKPDRVLALRFHGADSVSFGREPVPLTHLPMLGWNNHLGFVWGRFRGESALVLDLRYRWPVAYFADAQIAVSAGNVFARDLRDFDVGRLTTSFAAGIRTRRTGSKPIEIMFGFGTTRFDEPFAITSARLYFGVNEGL